jgi:hypothetical protein
MSTAPKVGQTTTDMALLGKRDAMHVPVVLARAVSPCSAGWYVRFVDDACTEVTTTRKSLAEGVVDPFITHDTLPGELVWVFLMPHLVGTVAHAFDIVRDGVKSPPPGSEDLAELKEELERLQGRVTSLLAQEQEDEDASCAMCYR